VYACDSRARIPSVRRDRLIAAAHSSIVEEGVAAMSIRNICNAAGHSQGAFYSNFASKDDLLVEILQAHIHDEVTLLRDLVAHCTGDDIEATLQVLAARLAKLADNAMVAALDRTAASCPARSGFRRAAPRRQGGLLSDVW
jgi:AcrR family transcriptional regulator